MDRQRVLLISDDRLVSFYIKVVLADLKYVEVFEIPAGRSPLSAPDLVVICSSLIDEDKLRDLLSSVSLHSNVPMIVLSENIIESKTRDSLTSINNRIN